MKKRAAFFHATVILLILFSILVSAQQKFYINLNDRSTNVFTVELKPDNLTSQNDIYQFAATAPGTYQTMDIGRFVKSFKAEYNTIPSKYCESIDADNMPD